MYKNGQQNGSIFYISLSFGSDTKKPKTKQKRDFPFLPIIQKKNKQVKIMETAKYSAIGHNDSIAWISMANN